MAEQTVYSRWPTAADAGVQHIIVYSIAIARRRRRFQWTICRQFTKEHKFMNVSRSVLGVSVRREALLTISALTH